MIDANEREARILCDNVVAAIDNLDTCEEFTTFSKWYKGEHARARSRVRKAILALRTDIRESEEPFVTEYLNALKNKEPRGKELRNSLEQIVLGLKEIA